MSVPRRPHQENQAHPHAVADNPTENLEGDINPYVQRNCQEFCVMKESSTLQAVNFLLYVVDYVMVLHVCTIEVRMQGRRDSL